MDIDMHLTQLLGNLSLDGRWRKADIENEEQQPISPMLGEPDAIMSDSSDTEDSICQPSQSGSSSCIATADEPPHCGCALVQSLHGQIHSGEYPTAGGVYLEAIFTHREVFFAFPQGHRTCAIAFSDLARDLELRDLRPDRDGDGEAAAAFRHEAWVIASSAAWSC